MSADLHLYALSNTDHTRRLIERWEAIKYIGSDDFGPGGIDPGEYDELTNDLFGWGSLTVENVWIGQVSWMKAGLLNDVDRYIPSAVARIQMLTGGGRVLTSSLIPAITTALNQPDRSIYGTGRQYIYRDFYVDGFGVRSRYYGPHRIQYVRGPRGTQKRQKVKRFLVQHVGDLLYPVSE